MYLGNPLLPINITAISAADSVKKELAKKLWQEYELKPLKLILMPYFLFNYYYFTEDSADRRNVKAANHGVLAIEGHNIIVREDMVELLKTNWKKSSQNIPRGEFSEKWCNIEKREQDEVLQLKTAEHFEVPKSHVVVSSARKMSVPFYNTIAIIKGKEYPITMNAVDGTFTGLKEIPAREKGYLEITKETVNELKDPTNWIKYSAEVINESISGATKSAKNAKPSAAASKAGKETLALFESKVFLIVLIIIAIIMIAISVLQIRF